MNPRTIWPLHLGQGWDDSGVADMVQSPGFSR
jgi:hypothetical protein